MKTRDISASDVQAEQSRLSKRLYENLAKTSENFERREVILQQSPAGAAHTAA